MLSLPADELVTVKPDSYVHEAAQLLAKFRIGLLLVIDESGDLAGVISERDIVGAMGDRFTNVDYTVVGDLMTRSVVSVSPQNTLIDAVTEMNKHGIRHLVAMENDKPVGIVSIRDVLQAFASELIKDGKIADAHPTKEFVQALAAYGSADRLSIQI